MKKVDFATFTYSGDIHRLQCPGHFQRQVVSNLYPFNKVIVTYQNCQPVELSCPYQIQPVVIDNIDSVLVAFDIDLSKPQYASPVDSHHTWKKHVVNHLAAIAQSDSDYIVFADIDCWIISQPLSWVELAIKILEGDPSIFLVSPNDGELERKTQVMSQQMFIVRANEFRQIDFNQPGYSGNVRDYPEMPEYHAMLEGRIHYYCKSNDRYRYVLSPEYRYWHFNRINPMTDYFETDLSKYV